MHLFKWLVPLAGLFGEGLGGVALLSLLPLPLSHACGSDVSFQPLLRLHAVPPAATLTSMMAIMSSSSKPLASPYLKAFFHELLWSWCLFILQLRERWGQGCCLALTHVHTKVCLHTHAHKTETKNEEEKGDRRERERKKREGRRGRERSLDRLCGENPLFCLDKKLPLEAPHSGS